MSTGSGSGGVKMQQHEIAKRAAEAVAEVLAKMSEKERDEYKSFCEGFPILLRNAGLLQSVVFLEAKGKHPHSTLLAHLGQQLKSLNLLAEGKSLGAHIAGLDAADYMIWTRMTDKIGYWHKRFAQALLKKKGD